MKQFSNAVFGTTSGAELGSHSQGDDLFLP
jgi:hypothetical protein